MFIPEAGYGAYYDANLTQLEDGTLMLDFLKTDEVPYVRIRKYSRDGGVTWNDPD